MYTFSFTPVRQGSHVHVTVRGGEQIVDRPLLGGLVFDEAGWSAFQELYGPFTISEMEQAA